MKAWLNLRSDLPERTAAFVSGLERIGYAVERGITMHPDPGEIFVTWNRIHEGNDAAKAFIARGLPVLVTENASWGNGFNGEKWLFLNRTLHNTAGLSRIGDSNRWDSLGVDLADWRKHGDETVILAQRGIGSPPVAMPKWWPRDAQSRCGGRIRVHPGNRPHPTPLDVDLANCAKAVTWSSGAAIAALMMGVPVFSEQPNWVGEQDNTDEGRLAMFRRLAWNQWRLSEFESGEAFKWMLQ
jgi:hypothetical protein